MKAEKEVRAARQLQTHALGGMGMADKSLGGSSDCCIPAAAAFV